MSWLIVTWFLAFGHVPEQGTRVQSELEKLDSGRVASVFQVGIDAQMFERFHLFGDIENFQYFDGKVWLDPYRVDYTIGGSFSINRWVSLNAEHVCIHPVNAGTYTSLKQSETKITLKIEGKTEF